MSFPGICLGVSCRAGFAKQPEYTKERPLVPNLLQGVEGPLDALHALLPRLKLDTNNAAVD